MRNATPSGGIIGLWPGKSSAVRGLLVGYQLTLFQNLSDETNLPGVLEESKVGWLGKSRWLRTVEEVNLFWDIVASHKV